jgi:hypothetical protein
MDYDERYSSAFADKLQASERFSHADAEALQTLAAMTQLVSYLHTGLMMLRLREQ